VTSGSPLLGAGSNCKKYFKLTQDNPRVQTKINIISPSKLYYILNNRKRPG